MKNNGFRLVVGRPTRGGRIWAFRLFCVATVLACSFSVPSLAQDNPTANVTGGGTADYIPRWTGHTTLGNSTIFQTVGGNVGVGTTTPATKLDVNGAFSIHGTSFSIANTGLVNFVSGQTFPGAGTITSVTAGTGLTGGGSSGGVTLGLASNACASGNALSALPFTCSPFATLGSNVFTGTQTVSLSNSVALGASNNSNLQTLDLTNNATPSNSNFTEAQFDRNGKATFFTDTLGDTTATGVKHAVVPLQNRQMVDVTSMESPEVWFEDFGSSQLGGGITTVSIDASFSQIVTPSAGYHVFVTPKGDCKGLFVTNETESSFEVRELNGGQSSVDFDYRIVAHRKGYEKVRLPIAKMPKPQR